MIDAYFFGGPLDGRILKLTEPLPVFRSLDANPDRPGYLWEIPPDSTFNTVDYKLIRLHGEAKTYCLYSVTFNADVIIEALLSAYLRMKGKEPTA